MNRRKLLSTTALCTFWIVAMPAFAADAPPMGYATDLPAVSEINAKLAGAFGALNDRGFGTIFGSVTVPISHRFGLQVDGLGAWRNGRFSGGVGAHGFWRDPSFGLFGVYTSYTNVGWGRFRHVTHVGVEGEIYLDRVTFTGLVGAEFGSNSGWLGQVDVGFYPSDNLRVYGGYRYQLNQHYGAAGIEYMPQLESAPGLAVFADGMIASRSRNYAVFAGLRYYFGQPKSLIRRHREDDPVADTSKPNLLQSLDGSGVGSAEPPCEPE